MQETSENIGASIIKELGELVCNYRKLQNKTIYEISAESSIPKSTWRDVEMGVSKDINLTTFWKIAEGLNLPPAKLLAELNKKLGDDFSITGLDVNN